MSGNKFWRSLKSMNLKCPNSKNHRCWKSMPHWLWKNWSMKLSLKMKNKLIKNTDLKTTELKSFRKIKAIKKKMIHLNKVSPTLALIKWKKKTLNKRLNKLTNKKLNPSLKTKSFLPILKYKMSKIIHKIKCYKQCTSLWKLHRNLCMRNLFLT